MQQVHNGRKIGQTIGQRNLKENEQTKFINMATTKEPRNMNTVFGTITSASGQPLANLKVEIHDVDMRKWQILSETLTDKDGKFNLEWQHEQLTGRGRKTADIAVKVLTREKNTELFSSSMDEVRFNASMREEINVVLQEEIKPERVEFDWLVKEVTFLANKIAIADLSENKEHRDVTFLSKELEVSAEKIEHLIVAFRLAKISKIEAGFFYALFRKDTLLSNNFSENSSARF